MYSDVIFANSGARRFVSKIWNKDMISLSKVTCLFKSGFCSP